MHTSAPNIRAKDVRFIADRLEVTFSNGLRLEFPLSQFPRLKKGTTKQRSDWELICDGTGIHWESLDEDISVSGLFKAFLRHLPKGVFVGVTPTKSKSTLKYKAQMPSSKAFA
jgi:hypothetical protein